MFSVIICTYNGGERLSRVLDSILNQNDFNKCVEELIIVDNHSTDETSSIVKKYKSINDSIVYLFEEHPGLSNARLCGVNYCSSEWIIFLDDDNFIQQNWIRKANQYVKSKNNIGAFNGHVIPKFNKELSAEKKELVKASFLGLACSTYSEYKIPVIDENRWIPFGAGLVVLTKPLKKFAAAGWMKSEGRKLNQIISGEDTEMTAWVKNQGYDWGFCNDMILYHEIGEHRLEIDYLEKLYYSFGVANYVAISQKSHYIMRRIKWLFIEEGQLIKGIVKKCTIKENNEQYFKNRLRISRARGYFDCLKKDALIKK